MGIYRPEEFGFDRTVCRGVFVGGCIRGSTRTGVTTRGDAAHSHNYRGDRHFGWICVADERDLFTPSRRPTRVMWHEYAHLLVPNANHGARWRAAVTALGWPSEARRFGTGGGGRRGVRRTVQRAARRG